VGKKDKKPHLNRQPEESKGPRIDNDPEEYYSVRPSWRLNKLELCDPFGWHQVDRDTLENVRTKLIAFESMTWREILLDTKKRNHSVKTKDLCKGAQERLEALRLDDVDRVLSLHLTGKERVWGLFSQGVLSLLWWDPNHEICPSTRNH
jgi:hypothetical protein